MLVSAGSPQGFATPTSSCELFNPATSTFSPTGPMLLPRYLHQATLLPSGKVGPALLLKSSQTQPRTLAQQNNPASRTLRTEDPTKGYTGKLARGVGCGKVFVAGGLINNPLTPPTPPCYNTSVCFPLVTTNTTEVFDPATGAWTMGPSMPYNRAAHDQLLLPDGKVLITAGIGEAPPPLALRLQPVPSGVLFIYSYKHKI